VAPEIQLRDLRRAVNFPSGGCSHQTRSLGSKYTENAFKAELWPQTHFGVFRAQGTCLVAANVVLFLLSDI